MDTFKIRLAQLRNVNSIALVTFIKKQTSTKMLGGGDTGELATTGNMFSRQIHCSALKGRVL